MKKSCLKAALMALTFCGFGSAVFACPEGVGGVYECNVTGYPKQTSEIQEKINGKGFYEYSLAGSTFVADEKTVPVTTPKIFADMLKDMRVSVKCRDKKYVIITGEAFSMKHKTRIPIAGKLRKSASGDVMFEMDEMPVGAPPTSYVAVCKAIRKF